jgi:hypothetical protein
MGAIGAQMLPEIGRQRVLVTEDVKAITASTKGNV